MTIESEGDFEKLRVIGRIVANCFRHAADCIEPGMATAELDAFPQANQAPRHRAADRRRLPPERRASPHAFPSHHRRRALGAAFDRLLD